MRTDAQIDKQQVICRNASLLGFGRSRAQFGDVVVYEERYTNGASASRVGRVAGRVHYAPPIGETPAVRDHLLVIVLSEDLTFVMERWINPDDVTRVYTPDVVKPQAMLEFLFSDAFRKYTPDTLRQWATNGWATPEHETTKTHVR